MYVKNTPQVDSIERIEHYNQKMDKFFGDSELNKHKFDPQIPETVSIMFLDTADLDIDGDGLPDVVKERTFALTEEHRKEVQKRTASKNIFFEANQTLKECHEEAVEIVHSSLTISERLDELEALLQKQI